MYQISYKLHSTLLTNSERVDTQIQSHETILIVAKGIDSTLAKNEGDFSFDVSANDALEFFSRESRSAVCRLLVVLQYLCTLHHSIVSQHSTTKPQSFTEFYSRKFHEQFHYNMKSVNVKHWRGWTLNRER